MDFDPVMFIIGFMIGTAIYVFVQNYKYKRIAAKYDDPDYKPSGNHKLIKDVEYLSEDTLDTSVPYRVMTSYRQRMAAMSTDNHEELPKTEVSSDKEPL
jgi:hypothetical protein